MQATDTHRIFSISEIVALICDYLEFRDLVNLLAVSRTFFHCASPHVWTELSSPQPLVGLLPHVGPDGLFERVRYPEQLLDQQSLFRFNLYAPLVRQITVAHIEKKTKLAWYFLLGKTPRRPLLPGLRRLVVDIRWCALHEPLEVLMCTLALLCSSLVEISVRPPDDDSIPPHTDAWTEPPLASLLLQNLAQTTPDLERLQLRVLSQRQIPYTKSSLFSSLAALRNLRTLHCSTAMIDSPIMLLLSTLPELHSLQIDAPATNQLDYAHYNGNPEYDLSLEDLMLPPHSFPGLRHLNIQYLPCRVVSQLWSSAPLVRQLISVHVRFHPDDAVPVDSPVMNSTICDICRAVLIQLSSTWTLAVGPNVEYLDIDLADVTLDDLVLIAQHLPKLQFLVVDLLPMEWPRDLEKYSITPSTSTLRLGSRFMFSSQTVLLDLDEDESMEDYINLMAQHLHTLWPNGISCEREIDTGDILEEPDKEYLNSLKSKLKTLNPPGFELPARKIYEATWLYKHSH
ncbi:hypothetical protein FRC12_007505 [Ceratobasidium sp. 428]|nr:hypothetical protein FRC12_007505 [Ceratobasidium sp. 428]